MGLRPSHLPHINQVQDPDLPAHFEAMAGDNHEQFCEVVVNEIKESEQK